MSIQDPIHGRIDVTPEELALIDMPAFQRLRGIKQLGFSDLAFPGATHTRFAHSIGAMHMATQVIEGILPVLGLKPSQAKRVRQLVRLAVLFHDLGHPPLSHVGERMMPQVSALNLGPWMDGDDRQATHEDYTLKLLLDSSLGEAVDRLLGSDGITASLLAAVIAGRIPEGIALLDVPSAQGVSLLPLLHQVVSGEVDADRMDYLRRDAYYCGVPYGQYDSVWLTRHLTCAHVNDAWTLALGHRGIWAFENFLLARYHMFLSVYFHHVVIAYDDALTRFVDESKMQWPSDIEQYAQEDDYSMMARLRQSSHHWGKRLVSRMPFVMLVESHGPLAMSEHQAWTQRLQDAGIACFSTHSQSALSRYQSHERVPLMVVEPEINRHSRIDEYTPLYRRFDEAAQVSRIYCEPNVLKKAKKVLKSQK